MQHKPGESARSTKSQKNIRQARGNSFRLSDNILKGFFNDLKKAGRAKNTVIKYSNDIRYFIEYLGEDRSVTKDSLFQWKQSMMDDGYANATINARLSAVNTLYDYLGRRDWQVTVKLAKVARLGQRLSREDYHELLREAKKQENIRLYLMIKLMACTAILVSDFSVLTREAVNAGAIVCDRYGGTEIVLPEHIRDELLNYAMQQGIRSGPVFLNRNGKTYDRTVINKMVVNLGQDAGLENGKATPQNLHQLYLDTQAEFLKKADEWVAESMRKLHRDEEKEHGWRVWLDQCSR